MGLPNFSVKRPVTILMITIAALLLGLISLTRLPIELYQDLGRGIISIVLRVRGGLSPQDVERMVTRPVEEAVASVQRLRRLYSNTREGEARVTLEYEPGTDMDFAALEVREKFSAVQGHLPKELERPVLANYKESDSAILVYSVSSSSLTPEQIREIVEKKLKPKLARANGVASVDIFGGRERKILVELDRDKLFAQGISVEKVMEVLSISNISLLAGNVSAGDTDLLVRTRGEFETVEAISEIGIASTPQGSIIPLKEVATIKDAYLEPEDYSRLNLDLNVSIQIKKTSTANTIAVTRQVTNIIENFKNTTSDDLVIIEIANRGKVIARAINEVKDALYSGAALTALIFLIFLKQWRLAAVVCISIPASVIITFAFMDLFGISINIMTLSGLSLAIGNIVDSSVVILENMTKKREEGNAARESIVSGAEEMWKPMLASTLTSIAVFIPIIFIDKEIQLIYQGLAFTVSVSLLLSLAVSVMLVPMLVDRLRLIEQIKKTKGELYSSRSYRFYEGLLKWTNARRYLAVPLVLLFFAFATYGLMQLDIDSPKTLEENEFACIVFPIAGANLEANDEVTKKVEDIILAFPEVTTVSATVRRDDIRIFVRLVPRKERDRSKDEIMKLVKEQASEAIKSVHQDYSLIIDEGVNTEDASRIVINIYGIENSTLEELAHKIAQSIGDIPGITNMVMTDLRKRPEYDLVVDHARAAFYGLTVREIADSVHAQVRGMRPTLFHEKKEGMEVETITRLQPIYRQKIEDLKRLIIHAPDGTPVMLEQVATFQPSYGPQIIDRINKRRYVFLKADITRGAMETIGEQIRKKIRAIEFPKDYSWAFGGDYEKLIKSKAQLSIAIIITIALVYMILASMFQSYTEPFIIMLTVPLAMIGVYLALILTKRPLSQPVFIGMIMLCGMAVNTGIILLDQTNILRQEGFEPAQAVVSAAKSRLRPILMTSISTVVGFLPLALNLGESSELWAPLAVIVIGGTITSTILMLFFVPNIYLIFNDFAARISALRRT
ncbi:MAG: efflux RND transporter permease subunit [Candidatus Omnitrophica bacterium]|nr:efflux RND transporter permease subunit [Candidatus Omnitrophota bacterium]